MSEFSLVILKYYKLSLKINNNIKKYLIAGSNIIISQSDCRDRLKFATII